MKHSPTTFSIGRRFFLFGKEVRFCTFIAVENSLQQDPIQIYNWFGRVIEPHQSRALIIGIISAIFIAIILSFFFIFGGR